MNREIPPITIEGVEFVYRPNFSGVKERYNDEGNRYFNAKVPPEMVDVLIRDGWNIKYTKPGKTHPNPDEHVPEAYLEVTVGFQFRPPTIIMLRDDKPTPVTERTVSLLDATEFESVDVVIRPYAWSLDSGESGVKAYLKSFYGIVEMDDLDRKYAHLMSGDMSSSDISEVDEN